MVRGSLGVILTFLGMVSIESEKLWFPIVCLVIGSCLLLWEGKSEERKKVNDYTRRRDDSRPYFLH